MRPTTRWAIYLRDDLRCVYCGVSAHELALDGGFLTLDHVKPRSASGPSENGPEHVVTACYVCNHGKARRSLRAWCKSKGWSYAAVRARVYAARRRDLTPFRVAARVLLGGGGLPRADLVDLLRHRARAQWASAAERGDWDRLDLTMCDACGRIHSEHEGTRVGAYDAALAAEQWHGEGW